MKGIKFLQLHVNIFQGLTNMNNCREEVKLFPGTYRLPCTCMGMSSEDLAVLPYQDHFLPCHGHNTLNVSHKLMHCSVPSLSALSFHHMHVCVDF